MVPRWNMTVHQVSLGKRIADVLIPPHSGCKAFVLYGTKRLQDCRSARSYRIQREAMRVRTPELQRNSTNSEHIEKVPELVGSCLVAWCYRSPVGGTTTEGRGHYSWVTRSKADKL